jgi:hypothetical protein
MWLCDVPCLFITGRAQFVEEHARSPALVTKPPHFPPPGLLDGGLSLPGPPSRRPGRNSDGRPGAGRQPYPMATMRSIGSFAFSAISAGTLTSNFISTRESRSFGSVIIFMYLQTAIRLASIRFAFGATCCSG